MARVEIEAKQQTYGTTIKIDGVEVKQVRTIAFKHTAGDIPRLYLEIVPKQLSIVGDADVEVQLDHVVVAHGAD